MRPILPFSTFATDLVRSHAGLAFRERPINPPEYPAAPAFEDLSHRQQLEAVETVCPRQTYRSALTEALPESDGYDCWLTLAIDANVSDRDVGRMARELILSYLGRVAALRGDDLAEEAA